MKKARIRYDINGDKSGYIVETYDDVWDEWWTETRILGKDKHDPLLIVLVDSAKKYFEDIGYEVEII